MSSGHDDVIDWHDEASAVIMDVKDHVKSIAISEKLITGKSSFLPFLSAFTEFLLMNDLRCGSLHQPPDIGGQGIDVLLRWFRIQDCWIPFR